MYYYKVQFVYNGNLCYWLAEDHLELDESTDLQKLESMAVAGIENCLDALGIRKTGCVAKNITIFHLPQERSVEKYGAFKLIFAKESFKEE